MISKEDRDKILAEFTWKMADWPWEETTEEIIVDVLTKVLNTLTADDEWCACGGKRKLPEMDVCEDCL